MSSAMSSAESRSRQPLGDHQTRSEQAQAPLLKGSLTRQDAKADSEGAGVWG